MDKVAIIVSGLPASGKTTVGLAIARELQFSYFDKDQFLEQLYDQVSVNNWSERQNLSRQSDSVFQLEATRSCSSVLVSHWCPVGGSGNTGTPTAWLVGTYNTMIEIYCNCPPEIAAARFLNRQRHPGHLDHLRDSDTVKNWMENLSKGYPLGLGQMIEIKTEKAIDIPAVIGDLRSKLAT